MLLPAEGGVHLAAALNENIHFQHYLYRIRSGLQCHDFLMKELSRRTSCWCSLSLLKQLHKVLTDMNFQNMIVLKVVNSIYKYLKNCQ